MGLSIRLDVSVSGAAALLPGSVSRDAAIV
jgi:hypothetical protein